MSLKQIEIENKYRSDKYPDIGKAFIEKCLSESVVYKRAAGFFSSSALLKLSKGISYLTAKDNCHIYLVVSPYLSEEDVKAIKEGYKRRDEVVEAAIERSLTDVSDEFSCERLNFLCHLIEEKVLDIKVADKVDENNADSLGMFHEKMGVFEDENGDKVAFSGSLNESDNAFANNFESIQVFKSWNEADRVLSIEDDFEKLWENKTNSLSVYDFPEAAKNKLFKYRKETYHKDIDDYEKRAKSEEVRLLPSYHCPFPLHDYQKTAINLWASQKFRGIFDMGTGTGKTITAYTASVKLLERLNYHLATIVVCPYTHLVEQWVEDQNNFNIQFIIGYSSPKYKNYQSLLAQAVQDFNDGIRPYFYFITTNASYRTEKVQSLLKELKGNVLIIGDEVHNFGASGMQIAMNENFQFRLGLSATVDRHHDETGTQAIYDYFGKPCIHYGLKQAIDSGVLTRYFYYPIVVYLSSEEQEKYLELTEKIRKNSFVRGGVLELTKAGEMYALQRARIIACASSKIDALQKAITPHANEHNMLVYCGTGKLKGEFGEEERQIDKVCKMLGNTLKMKIERYTSRESVEQREEIANRYKSGNDLQALVAIKCLDEGVNIPSIKTAFILASSTNPREYIQRRGRVLRRFPGKDYSYIYDFVTLPFPLDECSSLDPAYVDSFKALARNEIARIIEFSSLSENEHESDELVNEIKEAFNLDKFVDTGDFQEIDWSEPEEE
jgi:superfamily II DNA or RNA helicase